MKTLHLEAEEHRLLRQILDRCLADLDHEIRHTDHGEFKQMLRHKRHIIGEILDKLAIPAAVMV